MTMSMPRPRGNLMGRGKKSGLVGPMLQRKNSLLSAWFWKDTVMVWLSPSVVLTMIPGTTQDELGSTGR